MPERIRYSRDFRFCSTVRANPPASVAAKTKYLRLHNAHKFLNSLTGGGGVRGEALSLLLAALLPANRETHQVVLNEINSAERNHSFSACRSGRRSPKHEPRILPRFDTVFRRSAGSRDKLQSYFTPDLA